MLQVSKRTLNAYFEFTLNVKKQSFIFMQIRNILFLYILINVTDYFKRANIDNDDFVIGTCHGHCDRWKFKHY